MLLRNPPGFLAQLVGLRNKDYVCLSELLPILTHILTNRGLGDIVIWPLRFDPVPDSARRIPLLSGCPPVGFQNGSMKLITGPSTGP